MEVMLYIINNGNDEFIHTTFTEHSLVPNVNDIIRLTCVGDFVVVKREFEYSYDDEYGYQVLNCIVLRVIPKKEE